MKNISIIPECQFSFENEPSLNTKLFSILYLTFIMVLLLCIVIELKSTYQIDLFPGLDTPFDNWYFNVKEDIGTVSPGIITQ